MEHLAAFHNKSGSEKKPTSANTAHVAEEDSNSEEGVFRVQDDLGDKESASGLISGELLDDNVEDGNGKGWFSVTDKDIFEDVWDLEESQALNVEDEMFIDYAAPAVDPENVAMEINKGPTFSCQVELHI